MITTETKKVKNSSYYLLKKMNTPGLGKEVKNLNHKLRKIIEKNTIEYIYYHKNDICIYLDIKTNKLVLLYSFRTELNRHIFIKHSNCLKVEKNITWNELGLNILEDAIKKNFSNLISTQYSYNDDFINQEIILSDLSIEEATRLSLDVLYSQKIYFDENTSYFINKQDIISGFKSFSFEEQLYSYSLNLNLIKDIDETSFISETIKQINSFGDLYAFIYVIKKDIVLTSKQFVYLKEKLSLSIEDAIQLAKRNSQSFAFKYSEELAVNNFQKLQLRTFFNREDKKI